MKQMGTSITSICLLSQVGLSNCGQAPDNSLRLSA